MAQDAHDDEKFISRTPCTGCMLQDAHPCRHGVCHGAFGNASGAPCAHPAKRAKVTPGMCQVAAGPPLCHFTRVMPILFNSLEIESLSKFAPRGHLICTMGGCASVGCPPSWNRAPCRGWANCPPFATTPLRAPRHLRRRVHRIGAKSMDCSEPRKCCIVPSRCRVRRAPV